MVRERRGYERFYLDVRDMDHCLVVDAYGNGYETRIVNVGVGGLCFEVLNPAVGPKHLPPPVFQPGDVFTFSCGENDRWGQHIHGRTGRVAWADGVLYGLRFEAPLGAADSSACRETVDLPPLSRLKDSLWAGGAATSQLLRRLSADMARLLDKDKPDGGAS